MYTTLKKRSITKTSLKPFLLSYLSWVKRNLKIFEVLIRWLLGEDMASVVPVVAMTSKSKEIYESLASKAEALINKVVDEVHEKNFTGADVSELISRIEALVDKEALGLSVEEVRALVKRLTRHVANAIIPHVDDATAAVLAGIAAVSGSFFDLVRSAVLAHFDLDKDGQVSLQECHTVCCFPCIKRPGV